MDFVSDAMRKRSFALRRSSFVMLSPPLRVAHLQLGDRAARQLDIAVQIVLVEDRAHVAQAVSGDRRDLGLGAFDQREPRDRRAAQIVEREFGDGGGVTADATACAEAAFGPRLARLAGENDRRAARCGIERGLQRCPHGDHYTRAGLRLPQADVIAVITGTGCEQAQQMGWLFDHLVGECD